MMKTSQISVLTKIPNLFKELKLKIPQCFFIECKSDKDAHLKDSEIIIADFDLLGPIIYDIPNIKWVQGTWAGVEALMKYVDPANPPKYPIIRYSGEHFGRIISEYVVNCIVSHERDFYKIIDNQKLKNWSQEGNISGYRIISDLNIGIMGIGNIGSRLGNILKTFGATISAYARRPEIDKNEFKYISHYFNISQLNQFLTNCDYIINTMPHTNETKGLLNGEILENCKEKNTVFINVGRGSIIDDNDLIDAIRKEWISAAYLDVFNVEPLPNDSPLWSFEQVKITPHVAAVSRTKDIVEQFSQNLQLFNENKKIGTTLEFEKGY